VFLHAHTQCRGKRKLFDFPAAFFCSWGQCDQSGVLQFDAQSAASAADYRLAKNSQVAGVK